MKPSRLAVAVLLALLGGTAAPAAAAPPGRVLTIRGAKNAYVDVTFPSRFRLHNDDFTTKYPPQISAKGTYGGFYVVPLGKGAGAVGSGAVLLRGVPIFADHPLGVGAFGWLPAGRYRVHLVADGATTVRVRAEGLRRDLTLSPARPSATSATLVHRTVAGANPPADRTVIPVNIRPTTLSVLAGQQDRIGVAGDQDICLHAPARPGACATGDGTGGNFLTTSTPGGWSTGVAMFVYPGEVPSGEAEADFVDLSAGVPEGMWAFALTIS